MKIDKNDIHEHIDLPIIRLVGEQADDLDRQCFIVGGYVRDIFLHRPSADIDFVTVGSGIGLAKAVAKRIGKDAHLAVFRTYGTAQVKSGQWELEFVGARRESYRHDSRNPIVEDGTLEDDQKRRDFTINAMAISVNARNFGELIDPFDGLGDIDRRLIRTPLDPDITFSDDPLRMMRAIRFATQLDFDIYDDTFNAIRRNAHRIDIITRERIADELMKIMRAPHPSRGWELLDRCGLLQRIFPDLAALKGVDTVDGRGHKDNFKHTMQVLENVAQASDNEWLRWAALLHDIGKPRTKHWDPATGWTFHNHNFVGEKMIPKIFAKMRLPLNEHMKYVKKLVGLHMRPIALVEDIVTDSAVRRLLFDAGDDIDDLMTLCKADITSKNQDKVKRFRDNFDLVSRKLIDIEEKDRVRNFQPPINGEDIMTIFSLPPSQPVGVIKDAIKEAILEGEIANDYAQAYTFMLKKAGEMGLTPADSDKLTYCVTKAPWGDITLCADATGLIALRQVDGKEAIETMSKRLRMPAVEKTTPLLTQVITQLNEYFAGERKAFSLPLHFVGTEFQQRVWHELQQIPYGETITYGKLAQRIGKPKAMRAVAAACGANPIAIIVPRHRVVASDGTLGGYSDGGVTRKQRLLSLESP